MLFGDPLLALECSVFLPTWPGPLGKNQGSLISNCCQEGTRLSGPRCPQPVAVRVPQTPQLAPCWTWDYKALRKTSGAPSFASGSEQEMRWPSRTATTQM